MPKQKQFLEAEEAAAALGISRATLYAYVSRGLIRATQSAGDPRRRLYSVHDIAQLKKRKSLLSRARCGEMGRKRITGRDRATAMVVRRQ
jgi:citrate synthase